jgi:hypothetical protein
VSHLVENEGQNSRLTQTLENYVAIYHAESMTKWGILSQIRVISVSTVAETRQADPGKQVNWPNQLRAIVR